MRAASSSRRRDLSQGQSLSFRGNFLNKIFPTNLAKNSILSREICGFWSFYTIWKFASCKRVVAALTFFPCIYATLCFFPRSFSMRSSDVRATKFVMHNAHYFMPTYNTIQTLPSTWKRLFRFESRGNLPYCFFLPRKFVYCRWVTRNTVFRWFLRVVKYLEYEDIYSHLQCSLDNFLNPSMEWSDCKSELFLLNWSAEVFLSACLLSF